MNKENDVICSFYRTCINYGKECHRCKWNSSIEIDNFLELETNDGKTIRYLELTQCKKEN